ncbi:MAG: toxic anion resistance protein [Eubacteriaceae bacterium]|nr:toxic anion resistance protein [Eubacteriaceae bacterium]
MSEQNQEGGGVIRDISELPDVPSAPNLTLDELAQADIASMLAIDEPEQTTVAPAPEQRFTPEEMKAIAEFSEKIDISNTTLVLQYGSGAQKNIARFSETALDKVRTKDMGEIGGMLTNLVIELKGINEDEGEKGIKGMFKKAGSSVAKMKAKYDKAEVNVQKIVEILEKHQVTLLKDIAMFQKMYDLNLAYYKELGMYIEAGKQRLAHVRAEVIPALKKQAEESQLTEDAQAVNDMNNMALQFEKRLHDLELTRVVSIQMGPQIRLIQNNDSMMADKINSSLVNTIPLWKSQMVLALGMENSRQAMLAQREVTNMTNELLKKNADMLKQGTIDVAKESERGVVEVQTLAYTNEKLISTLTEVIQIQDDGFKKRREAESELKKIENDLRNKLREIRDSSQP